MPLPVLILGDEEGRGFFQERPVHAQFAVLDSQPFQLGTLVDIQRPRRVVHPRPLDRDPPAQQLLTDTDLPSHDRDRPAGIDDQMSRLATEGWRVTRALALARHEDILPAGS
jgi:hypothetical protein